MIGMIKKLIVLLVLVMAVTAVFYEWSASEGKRLAKQAGLPESYHNALKHAVAARSLYKAFDYIGVPKPEDKVIRLGDLNEKVETYIKFNSPDNSLEMMKDMFNNLAGVTAARFELEKGRVCKEDTLIVLAKSGGLRATPDDIQLPEADKQKMRESKDLKAARTWFTAQYYFIQARVVKRLNGCAKG